MLLSVRCCGVSRRWAAIDTVWDHSEAIYLRGSECFLLLLSSLTSYKDPVPASLFHHIKNPVQDFYLNLLANFELNL